MYNRVDKINMAPPSFVSPDKAGKKAFDYNAEMKQPKTRTLDNLMINEQERHTAGVYMETRGKSKYAESNNQTRS